MTKREIEKLVNEAETGPVRENYVPEFGDSKTLRALTGIGRSQAYELDGLGCIRSACIKKPGSIRGRRLWHIPSAIAFLHSQMEGGK